MPSGLNSFLGIVSHRRLLRSDAAPAPASTSYRDHHRTSSTCPRTRTRGARRRARTTPRPFSSSPGSAPARTRRSCWPGPSSGSQHLSHARQCDDDVLRMLVTGGPPVLGGGGMPQRITVISSSPPELRITGSRIVRKRARHRREVADIAIDTTEAAQHPHTGFNCAEFRRRRSWLGRAASVRPRGPMASAHSCVAAAPGAWKSQGHGGTADVLPRHAGMKLGGEAIDNGFAKTLAVTRRGRTAAVI